MIKSLKLYSHFVNKKGVLFLMECFLVLILVVVFVIACANINHNIDNSKVLKYYKINDVFVISVAKQLNVNEIEDLIKWYLPNSDYVIDSGFEHREKTTGKKECYAKNISIWSDHPVTKKEVYIKICF